jgi:hypothetical protein
VQPLRWRGLALAGATTLATGLAAHADTTALDRAQTMGATLWLAQAEGGEGGEAGAVAGADAELAALTRLHIVEGHLRGAVELYRKGMVDEAIGVAYHPEAEMMEEVREALTAAGQPDFTPALQAVATAMEAKAPQAEVDARLAELVAAIQAIRATDSGEYKDRFAALALLMRAAASEYGEAVEGGKVENVTPYIEGYGFVLTAQALAAELAADSDAKVAAAGAKATEALAATSEVFGDLAAADLTIGDPAVFLAIAARIELAASQVR